MFQRVAGPSDEDSDFVMFSLYEGTSTVHGPASDGGLQAGTADLIKMAGALLEGPHSTTAPQYPALPKTSLHIKIHPGICNFCKLIRMFVQV